MKTWIIPLAVLSVVPALGAAVPGYDFGSDQLVEGHTVFTVLENVTSVNSSTTRYAAAVAVLVRQATAERIDERFPGVLWFNDQYLVDPVDQSFDELRVRYPCSGAVYATNQGDIPAGMTPSMLMVSAVYLESYLITDPNDHQWSIDKWNATVPLGTITIWEVAILNNQATYATYDDGVTSCAPVTESNLFPTAVPCPGSEGTFNLRPMRCDNEDYTTNSGGHGAVASGRSGNLKYNAVLYFLLEDLLIPGLDKKHHPGAPLAGDDISGCQYNTDPVFPDQWPCPTPNAASNDDQEGNPHPYNPFYVTGVQNCAMCIGRNNHGGSATAPPGTNDGNYAQYEHATRNVDIYYDAGTAPPLRSYRVVDTRGSTQAFFCESDFTRCRNNNLPFNTLPQT